MKSMTKNLMAAALLMALPVGASFACTTTAWNGNTGAAAGAAAGGVAFPTGNASRFARYSGSCALKTDAGEFVTDNTPGGTGAGGESVYRARFYVYTGSAAGSTGNTGKVFTATTADGNTGTEVVGVTFNGTAFSFSGATGVSTVPAVANKWYSIEVFHQSGGAFSATVQGNAATTPTTVTGTSAALSVGSASLGLITGTGTVLVDEFESTRSADTAIGRYCRGNAAPGTDLVISIADRIAINNEIIGASTGVNTSSRQPDFNEDGVVSIADRSGVNAIISASQGGTFCAGSN